MKEITVDYAVRLLHEAGLECRMEWLDDLQLCTMRVYNGGSFGGGFAVHGGGVFKREVNDLIKQRRSAKAVLHLV